MSAFWDAMRKIGGGRGAVPRGGALLLPRNNHPAHGATNWPRCSRCLRAVDAYGVENETEGHIEIWAECSGVQIDPRTGATVAFAPKVHPEMRDSVKLFKGLGWSANRFTDMVRRLAFFAPEGDRSWQQTIGHDGVRPR